MTIIKKILTSWPFKLILCLMILLGTVVMKYHPRSVPFDQCSEEYRKYVNMDGIEASYVKDFKINDTLVSDVTVLKALDSSSFEMLVSDFNLPEVSPRVKEKIEKGEDVIVFTRIFYNDSICDTSSPQRIKPFLTISRLNTTLTIFHIKKESWTRALFDYVYPIVPAYCMKYKVHKIIKKQYNKNHEKTNCYHCLLCSTRNPDR